ncbi:MAG: HAD-IA family hydrolase [Pseudomonadota bacterium]
MQKNTLIFDLDGTLAHTAPDLIGTLNRIVEPHGLESVEEKSVGHIVGHGAKAMIQKAFTMSGKELPAKLLDDLFTEFLEDYEKNIANESHLFDGIIPSLDRLEEEGFRFCVCTNKRENMARILLDIFNISDRFEALTGGNTYSFSKPDPRHLRETVKLMGTDIQSAIMIGDSETDINAAKNADIPAIAVSFGYSSKPVNELGADIIINHFDELPDAVRQISRKG